jgi:uncharacterized membrane protein YdfJ with MMPL/SSD domain
MKPVAWMVAVAVGSGLGAIAVVGHISEILIGMAGPLAAAVGTWLLVERTHRREPERLTGRMAAAFGAKILFFAAYVVVALRGLALQPVPFVVSFTSYFIGLYGIEALLLWRLFTGKTTTSSE